jgi:hypothetical protein
LKQQAEQMALARLRQLSAHEVGHTLGFSHNFAASRNGNASVMDYPHPMISFDAKQQLSLNGAYGSGVGEWDDFTVQHAYGLYAPEREAGDLNELRKAMQRKGFLYSSDPDARSANSAHPDGVLWDFGPNSIQTFDLLMRVRAQALKQFSFSVLPPERQHGEIEARFVPIYLLHRYQSEALAHLLGGAQSTYGIGADGVAGTAAVASGIQHQALQRLIKNLQVDTLAIPSSVIALMTPPANGYERNREYFSTQMAPLFDALAAVEAASAQTAQLLFEPARINRIVWQSSNDKRQPSLEQVMTSVFDGSWRLAKRYESDNARALVQMTANWVILDTVFNLLDGGRLHPAVDAIVRAQLLQWRQQLASMSVGPQQHQYREAAKYIEQYLTDPKNTKRRSTPVIPPGAPI